MKSIISEIIETIIFVIVLYITLWIFLYFGINFNFLYVFAGLVVLWVVVKMAFRRLRQNKRSETDKNI